MDQKTNHSSTADSLLEQLKNSLLQNASDKDMLAAEKAAQSAAVTKRYTFRVMKKSEYLKKKQIADELAAHVDDTDITDDELEALLRTYLKQIPRNPIVEEADDINTERDTAPAKNESAPHIFPIDLDKPLSEEEIPFFEETEDLAVEEPIQELSDTETDDMDALLSMLPDAFSEEDDPVIDEEEALPLSEEDDSILNALLADEALSDVISEVSEDTTEDAEDSLLDAVLGDAEEDMIIEETAEELIEESVLDSDIMEMESSDLMDLIKDTDDALLSVLDEALPDEEPPCADAAGTNTVSDIDAMVGSAFDDLLGSADSNTASAISDDELTAMIAAIEKENAEKSDASAENEEAAPSVDEELRALLNEDDDFTSIADEMDALLRTAEEGTADHAAEAAEGVTSEDTDDGPEFDQTDLDLMIAFGMEDQLENAVGRDKAKKYKKALGDRGSDHYNEMHIGDHHDTIQNLHAEYVSAAQNKELFAEYKKKYSTLLFRFLGTVIFFVLLFFFENSDLLHITMPAIFDRAKYPLVYTLFDFQLVLLACAMAYDSIMIGLRAILRGRVVPESILGCMFIISAIYTVIIASMCPMHGLRLYNFPVALAALFEVCYEFMNLRREIMSFKIVSSKKLKYAVDPISPKDGDAERKMFAEYISDDPSMFRIKRTAFVEGFFLRVGTYPRTHRILRTVLPVSCVLMLAFFAAKFILTGSLYEAVNIGYITLFLTLPSCAFIAFSYPMFRASGIAYEKDSAMIGEASLSEYSDASVVSFDDKEVFPARGVRVRNVKVYGNNRIDHVIYAAASVFHVVGGPLAEVFEIASGELGYAENVKLVRLDRDGIEARVDGGTVLIGKDTFVNRYGYSVSLSDSERSMEETADASILFIAYENNIAAKLYIQYSVEQGFETVLKQLYRQGICVGIKTSDPNIDDHLLSCKIKMSKYPIKIIKCSEPKETAIIVDRLSSGIVSKSSAKALLQTLAVSDRVLSAARINNVIGIVSILLGMIAMAFFVISGMAVTVAPLWIALYQMFWILPIFFISKYYI